jgi:hypothetical protein
MCFCESTENARSNELIQQVDELLETMWLQKRFFSLTKMYLILLITRQIIKLHGVALLVYISKSHFNILLVGCRASHSVADDDEASVSVWQGMAVKTTVTTIIMRKISRRLNTQQQHHHQPLRGRSI